MNGKGGATITPEEDQMEERPSFVRPGYWCEIVHYHEPEADDAQVDDANREPAAVVSHTAYTPRQALRWIRIELRTYTSIITPDNADEVDAWLMGGHRTSAQQLAQGTAWALTTTFEGSLARWSVRPVAFLPLADREPHPELPVWRGAW